MMQLDLDSVDHIYIACGYTDMRKASMAFLSIRRMSSSQPSLSAGHLEQREIISQFMLAISYSIGYNSSED